MTTQIRLVEVTFCRADRETDEQTDMTKLILFFRNFANAPKKGSLVIARQEYSLSHQVITPSTGLQ
jgi:hypothetical protein